MDELRRFEFKHVFISDRNNDIWIGVGLPKCPEGYIVLEDAKIIQSNINGMHWVITGNRLFFDYLSWRRTPEEIDEERYVESPIKVNKRTTWLGRERLEESVITGWHQIYLDEPSPFKMILVGDHKIIIMEGGPSKTRKELL